MNKKVIVASKNPVKIEACKKGFREMFPLGDFELIGCSINSNVKDQPMSDKETITGAINRVENAMAQFKDADFWVGIEGGIARKGEEVMTFAWVVIQSKELIGKARTGSFFLPKKIVELIDQGKELGEADDIVFNKENSKQKNGAVGILTKDRITRTSFYKEGVVLALIPFGNRSLY